MKSYWLKHGLLMLLSATSVVSVAALARRAMAEESSFWSFQPVRSTSPPLVRDTDWVKTPVDAFILAKLEERGLQPASACDRRTLIRRATFDLTGLPPTPDEIHAFLQDDSPEAFAKVVDRLLESKHYGARWGRHWLDVVRYADARDLIQLPAESDFREVWRYRDWVVNSFNRDLPYDQFLKLQVAGDLLQPDDKSQIDADALVATGLLAMADFVPGDVDKQQMIADYVNDQIDVVGRAILGLTLACARCHDHKFDPISIEDYYSLAGIFFSTRLIPSPVKGNTPLVRVPLLPQTEVAAIEAGQVRDKARIIELTREVSNFGEREYRSFIERSVDAETSQYLLAAWSHWHTEADQGRTSVAEIAKIAGLDEATLGRWVAYCDPTRRHSALKGILIAPDQDAAWKQSDELLRQLREIANARRMLRAGDPVANALGEAECLQFRADDRLLAANETRQVTVWPNRGPAPENAVPVPDVSEPVMAEVEANGQSRAVLHFTGKEMLQAARTVPSVGSLFVVFRPDPAGASGQRLIGWEDSAVGQHGVGIMTDGAGSLHVIVRPNGANGDVVVPSSTPSATGFQLLCVSWGPDGVFVFRDGVVAGSNQGIDSVSSDPSIAALRIGGPGSGSSSRFQGDLAELRLYTAPLDAAARSRVESELSRRWLSAGESSENTNSLENLYDELVSGLSPFRLETSERDKALMAESRQRWDKLRAELESLQKKPAPEIPKAVVVQEGGPAETPHEGFRDAHVYLRGNHANPGKSVPRGFPKAIAGENPPTIQDGSGRRELAAWLANPANPLPARVMVNRLWQHHFGSGLVTTSANFGAMGDSPSHPELLDYLASRFIDSGWSLKAMHRLIMLSSVYQQSSQSNPAGLAADPENRLLWRANRRRLEAEAIRDSLFAVAGRLDDTFGGPGFQDAAKPRRSLYLMSVRTGAKTAEFGPLFDAADCSGIVERRNESIVAPQALFLMNDPLVTELATSLSERIIHEFGEGHERERIARVYEIVLGRLPTDQEIEVGMQFLAELQPSSAWASYCRLIVCLNEFLFLD
jgi:hypothetical protein